MATPNSHASLRERLNISRMAIRYPWLTIGFWIAVFVAGVLAFSSLKFALFPDITFPVVVVNASVPGKTAVETEQQLTRPIEQTFQGLEGVTDVDSITYPGQSVISVRFEVGTDLERSSQTVEGRLKAASLPKGATSKVIPINLNEASVSSYAIESDRRSLTQLTQTTKDSIIPALERIPGVLKVNFIGEPVTIDLTQQTDLKKALTQGGNQVRFNGREALAVQIVKRGDANTLEVADAAAETIQQLRTQFPDVRLTLAATQADYIRAANGETINALIEAIVISTLVIFPFLWSWRATFISALAIPTSLLGTAIVMAIYGFNLETITLLALAMIVGNVVDDAIVDVENITRHIEQGKTPRQAALSATDEIGLTVTAATLTVVAVFLPIGVMGGVLGQFFRPFGITISAAMVTSLLVSRTLSPLLAAYWLKPSRKRENQSNGTSGTGVKGMARYYRNWLQWSLGHRWIVVGISVLSFVVGIALIPLIPKGFIPKLDRGEFNVTYVAPQPTIPPELQAALAALAKQPSPEVLAQQAAAGQIPPEQLAAAQRPPKLPPFNPLQDSLEVAGTLDEFIRKSPQVDSVFTIVGSRQGEPNKGTIYVKLKPDRLLSTADVQDQFRQQLPQISGVTTSVEDLQFVDTGGEKPFQIRLVGEDLAALNRAARDLRTKLEDIPGLEDISTTADDNTGDTITTVRRHDGRRIVAISANLGQTLPIGEATDRAVAAAQTVLPAGITLDLGGDSAQAQEILGSFGRTLALSVLCIILVLFFLFKSWTDTVVVLVSLPLSIVGAMLGLLVARSDFGMISLLGIIFLLGLTNKNAILIVDYIKQLRQSGVERDAAILEATPIRLRPILMTTAATILGMMPLALGLGAGSELRTPMAISIMGGLITSTLLSLLVVPVIYALLDDARSFWKKRRE